jgi:hypothetical protein
MSVQRPPSGCQIVAGSNSQLDLTLADRLRTMENSRRGDPDRATHAGVSWREPALWVGGAILLWLLVALRAVLT